MSCLIITISIAIERTRQLAMTFHAIEQLRSQILHNLDSHLPLLLLTKVANSRSTFLRDISKNSLYAMTVKYSE